MQGAMRSGHCLALACWLLHTKWVNTQGTGLTEGKRRTAKVLAQASSDCAASRPKRDAARASSEMNHAPAHACCISFAFFFAFFSAFLLLYRKEGAFPRFLQITANTQQGMARRQSFAFATAGRWLGIFVAVISTEVLRLCSILRNILG
jgi:hypothetical protein